MVAIKLLFVFALCETAFAAFPMLKVKPEHIKLLHDNKGAFCLDKACVGLAGNQESFLEMTLGTIQNDELDNLPPAMHVAKHGMACHAGACAGIDDDMPFIMFLGVDNNPETKPIGIKETNGFICLEGSCVHLHGNPDDSAHIMEMFNVNGVKLVPAEFVGVYSNKHLFLLP